MIERRSIALPGVSVFSRASARGRTPSAASMSIERFVDLFDPVVALLVVAVDGPLDGGDALVRHVGAAGDVLFVPEQEVELVLLADGGEQAVVRIVRRFGVPAHDGVAVQLGDLGDQLLRVGQHGNCRRRGLRERAGDSRNHGEFAARWARRLEFRRTLAISHSQARRTAAVE